ncbi:MAG: lipid-A-disaccharide synthase [Prochlorococcaceae cyanobacterium]
MVRLLISTGEVSGDLQGSLLVAALHRQASRRSLELEIVALGGERMERAGATLLANTAPMGAIGLWEALPLVLPTLRLQRRLGRWLRQHPLDGLVLIDYMGANITLGSRIRREQPAVPITYYIAPQEWAFRLGEGGTTRLIGFTNKILAIFPEEARFYASRGADVTWVGHPLIDTLAPATGPEQARVALGLDPTAPVLLLMPASRRQELRYLLPPLAAAARALQQRLPALQVVVPAGQSSFEPELAAALAALDLRATVVPAAEADAKRDLLCAAADLALTKSGTVNLELALRGVPQVVGYGVSGITAFVARHLLRFNVAHISPVNLVLGERLVPELLQNNLTCEALVAEAWPLLQSSGARQAMLAGYGRLRQALGESGVTDRAAAVILDQITAGAGQATSLEVTPR